MFIKGESSKKGDLVDTNAPKVEFYQIIDSCSCGNF